jgi:hypothetical protein
MIETSTVEAQAVENQREEWISARVAEFAADPATRDRALAMILFDSLTLRESVGQMMATIQKEGLGGLLRAAMGAMKNGKG